MQWAGEEYLLEEVIDEARDRFEKPGDVYSEELIYWIGYIYRYWHYVTCESSKEIINLAPVINYIINISSNPTHFLIRFYYNCSTHLAIFCLVLHFLYRNDRYIKKNLHRANRCK